MDGQHYQAEARDLVEAERAASGAVRQLRQDLRDEKTAHENAVGAGKCPHICVCVCVCVLIRLAIFAAVS